MSLLVRPFWLQNSFPDGSSGEGGRRPWWCSVPCSCSGFGKVLGQRGGKLWWPSQLLSLFSAGLFCLTYCRSTMSRYNMSERSPPNHCRKSWGCWWGDACFSFLRKYSLCWACFVVPEMFLFQLRSCEICTPRNLMFSTLSTVLPVMLTWAVTSRSR